jgi:camphor 5-monooxygenase
MSTSADEMSPVTKSRSQRPANVPEDRVYEIDLYALKGIEEGYHEAWKRIQTPGLPELVWTPFNGGHWIATNGATVREVYLDPARFSSEIIWLPKEAGEKYELVPTRIGKRSTTASVSHTFERSRQGCETSPKNS